MSNGWRSIWKAASLICLLPSNNVKRVEIHGMREVMCFSGTGGSSPSSSEKELSSKVLQHTAMDNQRVLIVARTSLEWWFSLIVHDFVRFSLVKR